MRADFIVSGFIVALFLASSLHAQEMTDASKITCDQYVHAKVGQPRTVATWLSGFYHGKRDNSLVDMQNVEENLTRLERFCYNEKNFNLPVMQAIEQAIGTAK